MGQKKSKSGIKDQAAHPSIWWIGGQSAWQSLDFVAFGESHGLHLDITFPGSGSESCERTAHVEIRNSDLKTPHPCE